MKPEPLPSPAADLNRSILGIPTGLPNRDQFVARGAPQDRAQREAIWAMLADRLAYWRLALSRPSETLVPARSSEGTAPSEITLLQYPLHIGKNWPLRPEIDVRWTVEGVESFVTPAGRFPAYRIRVTLPESPNQDDEAYIWYGRSGRLGHHIRSRFEGTDEHGDPTGVVYVAEESEIVDQVDVSR